MRSKQALSKYSHLSRVKQEKFPSLHTTYCCIQKCQRKPPLLRGEQSEPWILPPSLSSEAREVSLFTYSLLVHSKAPQKTTTFERRAKEALNSAPLSLEWSERSFHLYIPLTGTFKRATENLKIRIRNQDIHSEIIINMVSLMPEWPVDEMALCAKIWCDCYKLLMRSSACCDSPAPTIPATKTPRVLHAQTTDSSYSTRANEAERPEHFWGDALFISQEDGSITRLPGQGAMEH